MDRYTRGRLTSAIVRNVIDDMHTSVPSTALLPILSHPVTCLLAIYQPFVMTFTPTRSPRAIYNISTACTIPAMILMKALHSVGANIYTRGAKTAQSEAKARNTHIVAWPLLFQIGIPSVAIFCGYEHSQSLCLTLDGWYGTQRR